MPLNSPLPGKLIVLEGIDGAGTTTQLHRLTAWLEGEGLSVYPTFEPSDGDIGRHLRQILRGEGRTSHAETVALMFAADRLEHLQTEILPRLAVGNHVLCDRYVGSSMAYQGSQCDAAWVRNINRYVREPDLTLYVRVNVDRALKRLDLRDGGRRELYERKDSLENIASAYDALYGSDGKGELPAVVIDGNQDATQVFLACRRAVQDVIDELAEF